MGQRFPETKLDSEDAGFIFNRESHGFPSESPSPCKVGYRVMALKRCIRERMSSHG